MSDTLQTLQNRSYGSLEWALNSPPKPHAFVSLPIQSRVLDKFLNDSTLEINTKLFNSIDPN